MPAWIYLFIAAIFEVGWAIGLKYSEGFTKLYPSIFTAIAMLLSYVFLSLAVKVLPLGTSYAIWTGIGVIGTSIYGIIYFNEPSDLLRIIFIMLIIVGIIGLKMTTNN